LSENDKNLKDLDCQPIKDSSNKEESMLNSLESHRKEREIYRNECKISISPRSSYDTIRIKILPKIYIIL